MLRFVISHLKLLFAAFFIFIYSSAFSAADTAVAGYFFANINDYYGDLSFINGTYNDVYKSVVFRKIISSTNLSAKVAKNTFDAVSALPEIEVFLSPTKRASNDFDPTIWYYPDSVSRWPVPNPTYKYVVTDTYPIFGGTGPELFAAQGAGTLRTYQNTNHTVFTEVATYTDSVGFDCPSPWNGVTFTSPDCRGRSRVWRSDTLKQAVYSRPQPYTCKPGFVFSSPNCVASQDTIDNYKKPANLKCEVLFDAVTPQFIFDARNPTCDKYKFLTTNSAGIFTLTSNTQKTSIITFGGTFQLCFTDTSKRCVITSAYSTQLGGYPGFEFSQSTDTVVNCGSDGLPDCTVANPSDPPASSPTTPVSTPSIPVSPPTCGTLTTPACSDSPGFWNSAMSVWQQMFDWARNLFVDREHVIDDALERAAGSRLAESVLAYSPTVSDSRFRDVVGLVGGFVPSLSSTNRCAAAVLTTSITYFSKTDLIRLDMVSVCEYMQPILNFAAWVATVFMVYGSINHILGGSAIVRPSTSNVVTGRDENIVSGTSDNVHVNPVFSQKPQGGKYDNWW